MVSRDRPERVGLGQSTIKRRAAQDRTFVVLDLRLGVAGLVLQRQPARFVFAYRRALGEQALDFVEC
jgi:hypothetical protein